LIEYKSEAFELFEALLSKLRFDVVGQLMHIQISVQPPPDLAQQQLPQMQASHINPLTGEDEMAGAAFDPNAPRTRDLPVDPNNPQTWGKVQRNAPCPCGSGRKFKHCHGALV
jgi:preprotein translocase subunit SecA